MSLVPRPLLLMGTDGSGVLYITNTKFVLLV